jgi:hypothetical protein
LDLIQVALKLQPKLQPTKQDAAWPGNQEFDFEKKASDRRETIVQTLTHENIEFKTFTLNHGDRYAAQQQSNVPVRPAPLPFL